MERKGNLLSVRTDVRVLDATIRDGGLVNDFFFPDEFIRDLYQTNIKAGVDYMEFGYKADKSMFDPDAFGKWKFCDEQDIRDIVGDNDTDMKISVMADVGRTDYKKDIIPKKDSVIDMIRIATYVNTIPAAVEMINYCADMGYETTINIMAVSTAQELSLIHICKMSSYENMCKTAHTYSTDTYKVDMYRIIKINMIHRLIAFLKNYLL